MKTGTEGRLVSAAAFNALLRGLLTRGALAEARKVVRDEMPRLGVAPNEAASSLAIACGASGGNRRISRTCFCFRPKDVHTFDRPFIEGHRA